MFGTIKKNNLVTSISKLGPYYEYRFEFYLNSVTAVQNVFEIRNDFVNLGTGIWIVSATTFNFHTFYNSNLHGWAGAIPLKLKTWMEVEVTTTIENGKVMPKMMNIGYAKNFY